MIIMFRILIVTCILHLSFPAYAEDDYSRLSFNTPTTQQLLIIGSVLGKDFIKGEDGLFIPDVLVSDVDLNGDKQYDLVVIQKSFCSNKTCEFHFLLNESEKWKSIAAITSWDIPYILNQSKGKLCNLIIITDDCEDCSTAKPVKYTCQLENNSGIATKIIPAGALSKVESKKYEKITWPW